jgi:hypothetical protein
VRRLDQYEFLSAATTGDTPYRAVSILADEESAIMQADRASPNRGVGHDEAGHEVLIFTGRSPIIQEDADHFIARLFPAILNQNHALFVNISLSEDLHGRNLAYRREHAGSSSKGPLG